MQKKYSLRKNSDFKKVYQRGKSIANRQLVLYYYRNEQVDEYRLGISISKKVGQAVVRNRIKRQLKEIVRHHDALLPKGYDYILIVRGQAVGLTYIQLTKSFKHVLSKAFPSSKRSKKS